jgi:YVTN family beta-propeller protein
VLVEFRILGPLEVVRSGEVVPLHQRRSRALLAALLLHANEVVASDRLIDALWGDDPPQNAQNALQAIVSRVRKQLGDRAGEIVRTSPPGYVIDVAADAFDLARFRRLVDRGRDALRAADAPVAAQLLRDALEIWRGPVPSDLADEAFLGRELEQLNGARLDALELRIDADLACGRHGALVGELESLLAQHPYREGLRGRLMLALYRSGRQAEALVAYQDGRRLLVDELGLEPSRALQQLERSILVQDPTLDLPAAADSATGPLPPAPKLEGTAEIGVSLPARPHTPPPTRERGPLTSRRTRVAALLAVVLTAAAAAAVALSERGSAGRPGLVPNSLGVIDPDTNRLVGEVRVGERPTGVAVGRGAVWVANADDRTLSRVDPRRREVVRTISVPGPGQLSGLVSGEGAVWLGTGLCGPTFLSRVSVAFNEIAQTVPLGRPGCFLNHPWQVAVGERAVWAVGGSGIASLLRIDPQTMKVVARVETGIRPIAIGVGAGAVWVAAALNVVARIDFRTMAVVNEVTVANGTRAIAVGAGAVWVAAADDDVIARIDPVTDSVTTIRVGDLPTDVAVGKGAVWVANTGDGTVSRVDPRTRAVVATIKLGASPEAIAVGDGFVWVTVSAGLGERPR